MASFNLKGMCGFTNHSILADKLPGFQCMRRLITVYGILDTAAFCAITCNVHSCGYSLSMCFHSYEQLA